MGRWSGLVLTAAAAAAAGSLLALGADARVEAESDYSKGQTYSGALRYLRVDLGYEVVEKDPEAAYLLFRYLPAGQRAATNGSIEIVEHRDRVRLLVQLPQMPRYHETVLRDGLLRKLRDEYGEPAPRAPEPDPEPDPEPSKDAGASD